MKSLKKIITFTLVMCLMITMVPAETLHAAKLNKTKVSLYVGKTYQLKLSGVSGKTVWSSSKKNVATVSSKGKITAKAPGITKITAKNKKKNYVCTVTVKKKVETNYNKKVTYTVTETAKDLWVTYQNDNNVNIDLDTKVVFYDASGKILSAASDRDTCIEKGRSCMESYYYPRTPDGDKAEYASYKITFVAKKSSEYTKGFANKIKATSNIGSDGRIMSEVVNTSNQKVKYITLCCIYYQGDEIVGIESTYSESLEPGASDIVNFMPPYDSSYDDIAYDNYKVVVNSAYSFN